MDLGLSNKRALVTASYRGTGAGIAAVLAAEGANVITHGLAAEHTADVIGDITTDEGAAAVVNACGPVDILINNYGVAEGGGWFDDESVDDWHTSYEKNVLSGVRLVKRFAPAMRERGFGRIVFISTFGAHRPRASIPHYYTVKTGLLGLTVSLAQELAGTGITVNCVSPGIVATAEVRESFRRRARERGVDADDWNAVERFIASEYSAIPSGRVATPEDVGALVAYLCSPQAASINGANLRIDGGASNTPN